MRVTLHIQTRKRQPSLLMLIGCVAGRLCFCYGVGWLHTDRSFRSYVRVPYAASKWPSLVTPDSTDSKKTNVKYTNSLLATVPTLLHVLHNCILCSSNWLNAVTFVTQEISFSGILRLQYFKHKPVSALPMSVRLAHVFLLFSHSNVIWWKTRKTTPRWGWVVNDTPRPLYSWERDSIPVVEEGGWAPGPVWMGREKSLTHRDSVPGPSIP